MDRTHDCPPNRTTGGVRVCVIVYVCGGLSVCRGLCVYCMCVCVCLMCVCVCLMCVCVCLMWVCVYLLLGVFVFVGKRL